jgi:hypothetical protein
MDISDANNILNSLCLWSFSLTVADLQGFQVLQIGWLLSMTNTGFISIHQYLDFLADFLKSLFAVEERTGHDGASVCFLW